MSVELKNIWIRIGIVSSVIISGCFRIVLFWNVNSSMSVVSSVVIDYGLIFVIVVLNVVGFFVSNCLCSICVRIIGMMM